MKKIILILIIFISCKSFNTSDEDLWKDIYKDRFDFILSNDDAYLIDAYKKIRKGKFLQKEKLTPKNTDLISFVLFNLKKYDELLPVIGKSTILSDYKKKYLLNTISFLNSNRSHKKYLIENSQMIRSLMKKKPKDSILVMDYFWNQGLLIGEEKALIQIDSMKHVNHSFSDEYYNSILKESISEYLNYIGYDK